jgi:hypothetical protein
MSNGGFKLYKSRNQYSDFHLKWQYVKDSFVNAWMSTYNHFKSKQINFPRENLVTPEAKLSYLGQYVYGKSTLKKGYFIYTLYAILETYFDRPNRNFINFNAILYKDNATMNDIWKAVEEFELKERFSKEFIKIKWNGI